MNLRNAETAGASSSTDAVRSVFFCPEAPNFLWDLTDTVTPRILVALASVASPAIIVLNALVIIAVKQKKELQRLSNILLSSLAVADLLVGASSMPLFTTVDLVISRQVLLEHVCMLDSISLYLMFLLSGSSLYHLTLIAWERYVAIQKWMDYKIIVTSSNLKKLATSAWFAALLTSLPFMVLEEIGVGPVVFKVWITVQFVLGVAALILIIYFYVMVYLGVRKGNLSQISQVSDLVKAKLENKVAKTSAMITAALIFSFVPAAVVGILGKHFPLFRKNWVARPSGLLMHLNSVANPLIYCYRDRRFRNAVRELIRLRKPRPIQPADGAVRFVRRKNPFASLEDVAENQTVENRTTRLARSASCGQDVVDVGFDHAPRECREVMLKRTMSAPTLAKGSLP